MDDVRANCLKAEQVHSNNTEIEMSSTCPSKITDIASLDAHKTANEISVEQETDKKQPTPTQASDRRCKVPVVIAPSGGNIPPMSVSGDDEPDPMAAAVAAACAAAD